jgi:arsenite methyltransferase
MSTYVRGSMERKELSTSEQGFSYFGAQAYWGVTKHMGGINATHELATLCHIDKDKYILEVGCGTGVSACNLVKRYGCQVIGVDISDRMIEWARKRARRNSVEHKVQFRTADAQNLPFEDNLFDVAICESVTAFPEDKQRAVNEYVRVTKAGGYVGMNEGTWIKASPPTELVEYIDRTMARANFLSADGWKALLETASLTNIIVRTYKINAFSQWLNEMKGLDFQDRLDRLRGLKDFISLFVSSSNFRKYAKEIMPSAEIIKNLFTYLGYGVYVGRKEPTVKE